MKSLRTALVTFAALAFASQLQAADSASQVKKLQTAKNKLASSADRTKGAPRALLLGERLRVGQLIDDLEHGRSVDPADIERALQRAENPGLF